MIQRIRTIFAKHGRHIATGALVAGFIFDFFTLTRIDQIYENVVFVTHLLIVSAGIMVFHILDQKEVRGRVSQYVHTLAPTIVQFSFGALFSGISIFYLRSATISVNIIFVAILFGLLIGNEFLREKYTRFIFQIAMLYFVLFSYLSLATPLLLGSIGAWIFLLSGLLSLVIIGIFVFVFSKINRRRFEQTRKPVLLAIGGIFVLMNVLYFTNIIPPIPLSLKHIDPYQSVIRSGNGYLARAEDVWWNPFDTVRILEGQPVYVFSSIFSPTRIDARVYHHWQYFDSKIGRWISTGRIGYEITGGRDEGFRGYTLKNNVFPGRWRVDVETERGQLIGRETFRIEYVEVLPELVNKEL